MIPTTTFATFLVSFLATTTLAAPTEKPLDKRTALTCNLEGGNYGPVNEVQQCVNWLTEVQGSKDCVVEGESTVFCQNYNTTITGYNHGKKDSVSSLCRDVADAAQMIVDTCTTSAGYIGGQNTARGNGNMIIRVDRRSE
ncbi:uncharacterized protein BDV14DRAFT_201484 [Aspergillus stella-maris]|uniref:uncharacterized protein n=1 Tax=Aspergillus stella-maris TaxID=1810926 RepID=UPI003CCD1883